MSTHPHGARRWLVLVFVGLFCLTALAPATVHADTNLNIGGKATITNTNGDRVRLRSAPSYDASVVTMLAEGDVVTVDDGPVKAADGTLWYQVTTADGSQGYIVQDYLQLADGGAGQPGATSANAAVPDTTPVQSDTSGGNAVTPTAADQGNPSGDANAVTPAPETPTDTSGDQAATAVDAVSPTPVDPATVETDTPTPVPPTQTPTDPPTTKPSSQTDMSTASGGTGAAPPTVTDQSTATGETETPTPAAQVHGTTTDSLTTSGLNRHATATPTATTATTDTSTNTVNRHATVTATTDTSTSDTSNATAEPTATPTPEPTATATTETSAPDIGTPAWTTDRSTSASSAAAPATNQSTSETTTSPGTPGSETTAVPEKPTQATGTSATLTTKASAPDTGGGTPAATTTSQDQTDSASNDAAPRLQALVQPQMPTTQPQTQLSGQPGTYGTGTITGTNGDGVRCRASPSYDGAIITVLPEGAHVTLTGGVTGDWQAVSCGGQNGFVNIQFIATGGDSPNSGGVGGSVVTGTAVVSGTGGDGLRCRTSGSTSAAVITVLPEGTSVQLRGNAQNGWQPVFCAGQSGWVSTQYLSSGGSSSSGSGSNSNSGGGNGSVTGTAVVSGTNGDGLNCRTAASTTASVIVVLPEGTQVDLTGSAQGGWQPVICAGQAGWMSSQYLSIGGSSSGGGSGTGNGGGGGSSGFQAGQTAVVTGTGGSGLNLRSSGSPSASVITVIPEGATVTVGSGSTADWVAVTYNGSSGFVSATYLAAGSGNSSGTSGGSSNSGGFSVGDHAMTTDALNLRYSASLSAGVAAVAPAGTVVQITSGLTNGFYGVDWAGLDGFMYATYLQPTTAALSQRGGSGNPSGGSGVTGGTPGSSSGNAMGQTIVNYAMQYLGYPYVWAAAGPAAFDCSGFTMWVYQNAVGINITHDLYQQYSGGTPVAWGAWQPGDLVFFQNTFEFGLSHVGIYIGNNQFINAENETTGVVISDITSQYYSSHYYGAVTYGS